MGWDWLPFGILRRPHGTEGEILLHPFNDVAGRAEPTTLPPQVRLTDGQGARELHLVASRPVANGYLVRFEGIADRESVAALVGQELSLPRRTLAPLGQVEFYVEELVGCQAVRSDGRLLGKVRGTYWNGAQDIMVIATDDGREWLLPVIAEYVLRFDGERGLLVVDPHD